MLSKIRLRQQKYDRLKVYVRFLNQNGQEEGGRKKNLVALKRTINIKRNNYNLVREGLNKTQLVADWSVNGGGVNPLSATKVVVFFL